MLLSLTLLLFNRMAGNTINDFSNRISQTLKMSKKIKNRLKLNLYTYNPDPKGLIDNMFGI